MQRTYQPLNFFNTVRQFFSGPGQRYGIKIKIITRYKQFVVWLVNGEKVRNDLYIDFTQGGNAARYKFIPKNEIWIDNALDFKEWPYVVEHEITEFYYMSHGYSYDRAHMIASEQELYQRKHPGELQKLRTKYNIMM